MPEVVAKKKIAADMYQLELHAPEVAKIVKPGQFVIIRVNEDGGRIPLAVADHTKTRITVVFKSGRLTHDLAQMRKGAKVTDLLGPLGNPIEIGQYGKVILVGTSFGISSLYLLAQALKSEGNKTIAVIGGRSKKDLYWVDRMKKVCDITHVCTEDGTEGRKSSVSDIMRELLRKRIDRVYAIGPLSVMDAVCKQTYQRAKTLVAIYANIIDGTGLSGSCRIWHEGELKFASLDGPGFDGHKVDFDYLINR